MSNSRKPLFLWCDRKGLPDCQHCSKQQNRICRCVTSTDQRDVRNWGKWAQDAQDAQGDIWQYLVYLLDSNSNSMSGAQATVEEWLKFAIRSAHILVMFPSHNFAVQNGYFAFVLKPVSIPQIACGSKMQQPEDATFLNLIELQ